MNPDVNILQELKELNSSIPQIGNKTPYAIPAGYFNTLAADVLQRIHIQEELLELSPSISDLSKQMLYSVPVGYFENLAGDAMNVVRASEFAADEEIKMLSPLLAGLPKKSPQTVPSGYFNQIELPVSKEQPKAKVVSITRQSWFRYAAAAVVTAFIVTLGFVMLNRNDIDPDVKPTAWVEKKLQKVSTDDIDEFVELVDDNVATANAPTPAEIKQLMQEVSQEDIKDFLDDATLAEPVEEDEILN